MASNTVSVTASVKRGVAVIEFVNPPVNALSARAGLVQRLAQEIARQSADATVRALVLKGHGRCFSAGADIGDFGDDPEKDVGPLRALFDQVDALAKPVVMALHGMALGGGLELALAGHARIATPETKLGLPEVTLGLLPGGGGTQRLPRLAGAAKALDMILSGKPVSAEAALAAGIVDRVVANDDLEAAAIDMALGLAESGKPLPRARDKSVPASPAAAPELKPDRALDQARARIADCVRAAASLPFDEGLRVEYKAFDELMLSSPSRGLRHAFLGERAIRRIPGLPASIKERPVECTAVIGAGVMGAGITISLLKAGLPVRLIDEREEALAKARTRIESTINGDVEKRRISAEAAAKAIAALATSTDLATAKDADLVIEAVFENINVKRQVFEKLDAAMRPGAILASNTSTLDLDAIAAFTKHPGDVVGMHFFSPANIMRLVEIVRGKSTSPEVLATAMGLARRMGKIGVVAGVCDGFIGNRIFEEGLRQAYFLLDEGASPQQIDGALERWGMAMGPLRVMDLAGQDIGWSIRKRRAIEQPDRPYSRLPDIISEMGRYGQKTGAGWFLYPPGSRTGQADPAIDELIKNYRQEKRIARRSISDDEIVARYLFIMANEGTKILAEGVAYRPVDIDMIYVHGYGFPAWRGGPMFYADEVGLDKVLKQIESFARGYQGWAWQPAPLLVDLAKHGAKFASLNEKNHG